MRYLTSSRRHGRIVAFAAIDHCSNNNLLKKSNPLLSNKPCSVSLDAKHANNKAAKKANHNRPRKSRPSDIHRKPVVYDEIIKPPEYTIIDDSFADSPLEETIVSDGDGLYKIMTDGVQTGWFFDTNTGDAEADLVVAEEQFEAKGSLDDGESDDLSEEDLGLPPDAELVEIVNDQVLVFE